MLGLLCAPALRPNLGAPRNTPTIQPPSLPRPAAFLLPAHARAAEGGPMPKHLSDDLKRKVRAAYEGTTRTHAEIAAEVGVGRSTVSVWAAEGGWTRPRGAHLTPRLVAAQRATAARLFRGGARGGVSAT